ncbi:PDDEXK nuclease domain-containing protein [Caldithrix abyssi]
MQLYWEIGKKIVEKQETMGWGKAVVENPASDLQLEFPGIKSFSARNLWNMRNFFLAYREDENLQTLSADISWSHNIAILEKCASNSERRFYMEMAKKFGWSYRVLVNQIESQAFQKYLSSQTNFSKTIQKKYRHQAHMAVKDEYVFDFLEVGEEHSERELERNLLEHVRQFLIEMGGYFAFIGNQFRLEIDDEEFFIDLLLYHRALRCLVAVELKMGKFKPEYAGKMQFYLSVLDDCFKLAEENPSIGIIIGQNKNRTIVEYTLKDVGKPIGVSTYKVHKRLPEKMSKYFPTAEEFAEKLKGLFPEKS